MLDVRDQKKKLLCVDVYEMRIEHPSVKILADCQAIEPTRVILPGEEIEEEEREEEREEIQMTTEETEISTQGTEPETSTQESKMITNSDWNVKIEREPPVNPNWKEKEQAKV